MPLESKIKKEIEALKKQIAYHDQKYYQENQPEISDAEYDYLLQKLENLEKKHPQFITPDSPSQKVSGRPLKEFKTAVHSIPMLSLQNTYSSQEIIEFEKRVKKLLPDQDINYVVELKIDGIAVALRYENKRLTLAISRGDGVRGDNITANIKTIKTLPFKLKGKRDIPLIEIAGEVYISKQTFKKINKQRQKNGEALFANARNAAAGSLKLLDARLTDKRSLDISIYGIRQISNVNVADHYSALKLLKQLGFNVNPHISFCKTIEEVVARCNYWEKKKENLDFEIDGLVIKVNNINQQRSLGATGKSPRWAIAFKFAASQAISRIENITVQVGRTGILTPVAKLTPTQLAGSIIKRATLHNQNEIKRKDIRMGDVVIIEKGGDIIPKVVKPVIKKRTGKEKIFRMPNRCPACGGRVVEVEGEVAVRCNTLSCPVQLQKQIQHYASRDAMNIETLGPAVIKQLTEKNAIESSPNKQIQIKEFIEKKPVKSLADIYHLKPETLASLERMGLKSAHNLIAAIEKSKNPDPATFLYALGIHHVGKHTAKILSQKYTSVSELQKAKLEDLVEIKDIGPIVAKSVYLFFRNPENKKTIKGLLKAGINIKKNEYTIKKLSGKTFVITGTLEGFSRIEAGNLIKDLGGSTSSQINNKTDYLVVGKNPGSKLTKAKEKNIKILDEVEFRKIIS
jgi:DNA ligase (NAD+)